MGGLRGMNWMWVLVIIMTIANIIDFSTALYILPGEANPIYVLTGSFTLVAVLKFGLNAGFIWILWNNHFTNERAYYVFVMAIVYCTLGFTLGAYSNTIGIVDPVSLEEYAATPAAEKISDYFWVVGLLLLTPMLITWGTYEAYVRTKKHVVLEHRIE